MYEGESRVAKDNIIRRVFDIAGLTPGPIGTRDIELSMTANADGIAHATAREVFGGQEVTLVVTEKPFHTQDQYASMKILSDEMCVPDERRSEERPRKSRRRHKRGKAKNRSNGSVEEQSGILAGTGEVSTLDGTR